MQERQNNIYDVISLSHGTKAELELNKDLLMPYEPVIAVDENGAYFKDEQGNLVPISGYDRGYVVDTIEILKTSTKYKVGDVIQVLGYYTKGDEANHLRIISATDDGSGELLVNGLYANIVHSGEVNVSWFGAKGDGVTDDSGNIQKALNMPKVKKINMCNKKYMINNTLYINNDNRGICISGQNMGNEESEVAEFIPNTGKFAFMELVGASYVTIENINIMARSNATNLSHILFFLARGVVKQHCNRIIFKDVNMKISSIPTANNNLGTICLYNYKGEILSFYNTRFLSDTPIVMSGEDGSLFYTPKHAQVKPVADGDSCTIHNFYDCMIESRLNYCLQLSRVSSFNMFGSYFANWGSSNLKVLAKINHSHSINIEKFHAEAFDPVVKSGFIDLLGRNSDLTFKGYIMGLTSSSTMFNFASDAYLHDSHFDIYIIADAGANIKFIETTSDNQEVCVSTTDFYRFQPSRLSVNFTRPLQNCRFFSRDGVIVKMPGSSSQETGSYYSTNKQVEASSFTTNVVTLINNSLKETILSLPSGLSILSLPASNEIPRPIYGYVTRRVGKGTINDATVGILTTSTGGAAYRGEVFTVVHNANDNDIIINRELLSNNNILALDTPYYTTKMQQEGIYDDFVVYMDEKLAYDKKLKHLEEQRQLAFESRENQEQTYEEWISEQPQLMPTIEPQPSDKLLAFKEKYLP